MKRLIILPLLILIAFPIFAQYDVNNVIKLNLASLPFKNISMQYEHAFHDNMSGALGLSYLPKRSLPNPLIEALADSEKSDSLLRDIRFTGFTITPEFRYYPGGQKGAPSGFYLAPFFRFASNSVSVPGYEYTDNTNNTHLYDLDGRLNSVFGGLLIGAQWIIKDRVTIDWWIISLGAGSTSGKITAIGDFTSVNEQEVANNIQANFSENVEMFDFESSTDANSAWVKVSTFSVAIPRSGLSIGYIF